MSSSADDPLLPLMVLLGLRLKGFVDAPGLAERLGLGEVLVRMELERYESHGWVSFRQGRLTGWSLTPAGRDEGTRRLASQLIETGQRSLVHTCYLRFVELNGEMLAACNDWQVVEGKSLNDHSDPAYDTAVINRLARVHERVMPICADLASALDRFASYGPRLRHAVERLQAGEHEYFTSVRLPSYHTVWFELHEDLLATLGINRGGESGGGG